MRKGVASVLTPQQAVSPYTYQVIENIDSVFDCMHAISRTGIEDIALVKIALYFEQNAPVTAASTNYLLDDLRPLVRKTDYVFLLEHAYYFVLPGANLQGGSIVQERLWDALLWSIHNTHEGEVIRPRSVSIGHSAYPSPCATFEQFLSEANTTRKNFTLHTEHQQARIVVVQPIDPITPQETTESELQALARQLGVPYLPLLPRKIPARIRRLISIQLALDLRCYPLGREHDTLTVAMLHPDDNAILERLRRETGLQIFPVLAHPQELQNALEQLV